MDQPTVRSNTTCNTDGQISGSDTRATSGKSSRLHRFAVADFRLSSWALQADRIKIKITTKDAEQTVTLVYSSQSQASIATEKGDGTCRSFHKVQQTTRLGFDGVQVSALPAAVVVALFHSPNPH